MKVYSKKQHLTWNNNKEEQILIQQQKPFRNEYKDIKQMTTG